MRLLAFIFLAAIACDGQIVTSPSQKTVPVTDSSALITIKDVYTQTNAQNAQLASMGTQVGDIKDSVTRIEAAQKETDKSLTEVRHDVDRQGVVASLFVYSVQIFFTIIIAVCVTVPGTFFVQKVLNEKFTKPPTQPPAPV
jgi:hypothetical protein